MDPVRQGKKKNRVKKEIISVFGIINQKKKKKERWKKGKMIHLLCV